MIKSTAQTYGKAARFLHWASALLILTLIPLGIAMTQMADGSTKSMLYLSHVNIGLVVLLLTALRVLWRFIEPSSSLPNGLSPAKPFTPGNTSFSLACSSPEPERSWQPGPCPPSSLKRLH